mgnify:CR=1 FL=1
MKKRVNRLFSALLLCVFVNFVFSNTVFMHSHITDNGRTVTHSHPYMPSGHHAHSSVSLDLVAQFNASASSMESASAIVVDDAYVSCHEIVCRDIESFSFACVGAYSLRGPPVIE